VYKPRKHLQDGEEYEEAIQHEEGHEVWHEARKESVFQTDARRQGQERSVVLLQWQDLQAEAKRTPRLLQGLSLLG